MSHGASGPQPHVHSALDGVDLKKPLHESYMYKQAHTHLGFNLRYFVLYPGVLLYFQNESDYKRDVQKGTLGHCHKGILLKGLWLTKPEKKPKGAKYCFLLHTPHPKNERHEVLLVPKTRQERRVWVDKLQEQNPLLIELGDEKMTADTPPVSKRQMRADSLPYGNLLTVKPAEGEAFGASGRVGSFLDLTEMDIRDGLSDVEEEP